MYLMETGCLFVVATPIGNLADITQRAIETLRKVDLIAAEDTRHSRKLLACLAINARLVSLHDHNERSRAKTLIEQMQQGALVALVSDAGTPTISDPGYYLVRTAQDAGIPVSPVPGASAVVAALSASGLPVNRFYFHGFLPDRAAARREALQHLADIRGTLVFYESSRRMIACLQDISDVLGGEREMTVARELTKVHETVSRNRVSAVLDDYLAGRSEPRGEFVLLVAGAQEVDRDGDMRQVQMLLDELGGSLPAGRLASAVSRAMSVPRKRVYRMVLDMKGRQRPGKG